MPVSQVFISKIILSELNNMKKASFLTFVAVFFASCFFSSCKFYHNTTALYNSYFLANEKMLELEEQISSSYKDDYNNILRVFPPVDSLTAAGNKAAVEYIIDKAGNPVQYHEKSKWVDDSYLLIAKARFYAADMKNAVGTFKYVNTISKETDAKHAALVGLLRVYTEEGLFENADFIIDYISRETNPFSDENEKNFYLAAAHLSRQKNELEKCADYLQKGIPLVKPAKKRARLLFLLGQIFQSLGKNEAAFEAFNAVKNSNPDYDLLFNAELNASQVITVADRQNVADTEKSFTKMLRDGKNKDMKDKIYFRMADFYFKINKINDGLSALNQSLIHTDEKNKTQKAYSYLKFGEIYYEKLQNFEKSGIYYDSARSVLTPDMKGYAQAVNRIDILSEFIAFYKDMYKNEKLLALSAMTKEEREKLFEKEEAAEKKAIDDKIAWEENKKNQNSATAFAVQEKSWYFYDAVSIETGLTAFRKDWGERPLEDHWRRSQKIKNDAPKSEEDKLVLDEEARKKLRYKAVKSREEREKIVPKTEKDIKQCNDILASAWFNIGKIYYQKLNEKNQALTYFLKLNEKYPDFEPKTEVLYMLYLLCKDTKKCDENIYAKILEEKFSHSVFAKLIKDPDLLKDGSKGNDEVTAAYQEAYSAYSEKQFALAVKLAEEVIAKFPKSQLVDRLHFLKINCLPHTEGKEAYKTALNDFIEKFPESKLAENAKKMLNAAK
jgi:outer membrane protein assembly factor BamD (BamD/ComL family)